jgi:CheY-like chemotaxis protein
VTLPLIFTTPEAPLTQRKVSASPTRRRVLIADDNVDAAQMLFYLLDMSGYEARIAADGPEALKVFDEFQPEVVLLDIGMPGMSGYEVAGAIRARTKGTQVLLVAVSGWGQESDRQASFVAGFDHHLTKPVHF